MAFYQSMCVWRRHPVLAIYFARWNFYAKQFGFHLMCQTQWSPSIVYGQQQIFVIQSRKHIIELELRKCHSINCHIIIYLPHRKFNGWWLFFTSQWFSIHWLHSFGIEYTWMRESMMNIYNKNPIFNIFSEHCKRKMWHQFGFRQIMRCLPLA